MALVVFETDYSRIETVSDEGLVIITGTLAQFETDYSRIETHDPKTGNVVKAGVRDGL